MQPFKLSPSVRLESVVRVWDRQASEWTLHRLAKPRLIANPPQQISDEQRTYLAKHISLLAECIKLDNEIKKARAARQRVGPDEYFAMHYRLLGQDGLSAISETPAMRQLQAYLWELADRYKAQQITWDAYEDEIERWFLLVSDKLAALRGPVPTNA